MLRRIRERFSGQEDEGEEIIDRVNLIVFDSQEGRIELFRDVPGSRRVLDCDFLTFPDIGVHEEVTLVALTVDENGRFHGNFDPSVNVKYLKDTQSCWILAV